MNKYIVSLLLCYNFFLNVYSQNIKIDSLIQIIGNIQIENHDFYNQGMFETKRYKNTNHISDDDNIFFSSLVALNLKLYYKLLSDSNKTIAKNIIEGVQSNFDSYQNKKNNLTYNFWKKTPNSHFPNSNLSRFKKFAIPDDLDDTSIIYLVKDSVSDSIIYAVCRKMQDFTNNEKKIKSTSSNYSQYISYSTWFGDKMPIDFDMCVHSNILLFKTISDCGYNQIDYNTVALLKTQLCSDDFLQNTYWMSQHYQKSSIIYYHIARVCYYDIDYELFDIGTREYLSEMIDKELTVNANFMEQILLQSAKAFLGETFETNDYIIANVKDDFFNFSFFIANMTSTFRYPLNKWFSKTKFMKRYYYSEAYYYSLLLEHELLMMNN